MSKMQFGRYTVELSNEDKTLFPDAGITKRDLAEYYREISHAMLPHVRGRAINMQRFPDGIEGKSFFHKDVPDYFPDWIRTKTLGKKGGEMTHVVADNAATLVYLANQACITPHTWLSRVDELDCPDLMVFDLDPPGDDFKALCAASQNVRGLFDELGLTPFVKTTGSRGLHVAAPLDRSAGFDEVREFARDMARVLAARHPDELTTEQRKNKRDGRIFLDTMRNAYGQTIAPPYAVRAREGAPVVAPLDWDEVDGSDNLSRRYSIENIFKRLGQKGDPWKTIRRSAKSLRAARGKLDALLEDE